MKKVEYCKFNNITLHKGLLESPAWIELTQSGERIFFYIWSCLQWAKIKSSKKKKHWEVANNGDIEISTEILRKKLGLSKATVTKGIHKLIKVGLIKLTRIGANKICHKYKILYKVVPQSEERWRKYPEKNWESECPSSPNNLVGKDTRFRSHPKKLNRKSINQNTKIDRNSCNSLKKCTVSKENTK